MAKLEFFFDCSSPWTYLAFHNIQPVLAARDVDTDWRPILVGGLFNTINPSVYAARENPVPAKQRYQAKDLQDWARASGITITWTPAVFPVNSVKAMRGCIVAGREGKLIDYARATFEAYWGADRDISQPDVLADIAGAAGLDPEAVAAATADQEIKDALKRNTEEVAKRGGFGTPTMFVNGADMYFGNDRLPLVEAALQAAG